jgi:hypothetical protein
MRISYKDQYARWTYRCNEVEASGGSPEELSPRPVCLLYLFPTKNEKIIVSTSLL